MQRLDWEDLYTTGVGEEKMSSILSSIGGFLTGMCIIQLLLHSDTPSIIMAVGFGAGITLLCYNFWVAIPKESGRVL
jgi:hypothetical protein